MTSRVAKRYRVLIAFNAYAKGQIVELPGGIAAIWVGYRMIEPVEEEVPAIVETATAEPEAERAVLPPPVKRKRGRPRKVLPDELGYGDKD